MNFFGLNQAAWLMVHALIFIVTAVVIWQQLRTVSRASSIEGFYPINDKLRSTKIRALRRIIYKKGRALDMTQAQIDYYSELKELQEQGLDSKDNIERLENEFLSINQMIQFIKQKKLKERVQELILVFEVMGVMVNHGGLVKEIMIGMYWDVIIKSWDCLFPVVLSERKEKIEFNENFLQKRKFRFFLKRLIRQIAFLWIKNIEKKGDPKDKGFLFEMLDFCPATSYKSSHYENFETLTKHAEWYAWKRGISRPTLCRAPRSNT